MPLGSDHDVARLAISLLDLTDLADGTTAEAASSLCVRALAANVAAVCVWPRFVAGCAGALDGSVKVATVVNFPTGAEDLGDVLAVTSKALADGADEIDVVLPYQAWLAGDIQTAADVLDGVGALASGPSSAPRSVKVIIETGELPDRAAIDRATHFAIAHGADFVKTSTGKAPVSATLDAVETVIEAIDVSGRPVGVKASGGIRTLADARAYLELAVSLMGDTWISPTTFRFGASTLLDDLLAAL